MSKNGDPALKCFWIGLFVTGVGQFYQCLINNTATLIWLKAGLVFLLFAGIFAVRAMTNLKQNGWHNLK